MTNLVRTLIDLSAVLDKRRLSVALDSALARYRQLDAGWLGRGVRRLGGRGRKGIATLTELLNERRPDAEHLDSALERRLKAALHTAKLPRPVEHYEVIEGDRFLAELDFAYPRQRLGIQTKGGSIHRRHAVWENDQIQESELAAVGWRILHVTWAQMEEDESAVIERVGRALAFN